MLHAALLFALAIQAQTRCNSDFFQNSWALLRDARWGVDRFEKAAFAVRNSDGSIEFARWPGVSEDSRATFDGSIPPNAFAIVHTHPNSHPQPSGDDDALARRLGIPVYVLTRTKVSFTTGREMKIVAAGDWNPERCQ